MAAAWRGESDRHPSTSAKEDLVGWFTPGARISPSGLLEVGQMIEPSTPSMPRSVRVMTRLLAASLWALP